jgi:hypothetical protein
MVVVHRSRAEFSDPAPALCARSLLFLTQSLLFLPGPSNFVKAISFFFILKLNSTAMQLFQ